MAVSGKKILVAEDEDSLNEMLVLIFRDEGYQVDSAVDGNEAWGMMNARHYDVLVTDLYMPNMNGFDLIVKSQSMFPATKIILLSGGGKDIEAEHGKKEVAYLGSQIKVDMFLKKPCNLGELLGVIEDLLQS